MSAELERIPQVIQPKNDRQEPSFQDLDTSSVNMEEFGDQFEGEYQAEATSRNRFNQLDPTAIGQLRETIQELANLSPTDPGYAEAQYALQEIHAMLIAHLHTPDLSQLGATIERSLDLQIKIEKAQEKQQEQFGDFMLDLDLPVQLRKVVVKGIGLQDKEFEGLWCFDEVRTFDMSTGEVSGKAHFTGKILYMDGESPTNCVNFGLQIESAQIVLAPVTDAVAT